MGRAIVAGAINPSGSIEAVDGGYRVSGRWAFASGCQHASWIFGDCFEGVVDGVPQLRIAVFSPDQVEHRGHLVRVRTRRDRQPPLPRRRRRRPRRLDLQRARRGTVHRRDHRAHPDAGADRVRRGQRGHRHGAGRARRDRRPRRAQGAAPRPCAARREPDVPARPGDRRHRAARQRDRSSTTPPRRCGRWRSRATSRRSRTGRVFGPRGVGDRAVRVRRRHRLPRRRRQLAVPRQPAAAPAPRHPRPHPALHHQAGHDDDSRRHPRRQQS